MSENVQKNRIAETSLTNKQSAVINISISKGRCGVRYINRDRGSVNG